MSERAADIFETFNARFVNADLVGSRFVRSPFLKQVVGPGHTAVLGPRGSGKTTLLKMLTLPALLSWADPARDKIAEAMNYLAVYVPASLTWSSQYRAFSVEELPAEIEEILSISLFRHNMLMSLLDTWRDASDRRVAHVETLARFHLPIDPADEPRLVRRLANAWELQIPISTIGGIQDAIISRFRILQRLSFRGSRIPISAKQLLDEHPFLSAHYIDDATSFLQFLEQEYKFDHRIALSFDEVEIATDTIANSIMRLPRSIDQRFFIKYSAAPYVGVASANRQAVTPTQRNDFQLVFLTSFASRDMREFSESLFAAVCQQHGVSASVSEVLGHSLVDEGHRSPGSGGAQRTGVRARRYKVDGAYQRKFESLYAKDASFRAYVKKKGIDLEHLELGTESKRAANIRKIIWMVLVRDEFLFQQESNETFTEPRRRLRSLSALADIYTGAGALFAICEGNPRWIMGLMESLVAKFAAGQAKSPVPRTIQKDAIERMLSDFFALLSTIPTPPSLPDITSVVELVERVGNYFRSSVLGATFTPDPTLSFWVDPHVSAPVRDLIGRGINLGAFVVTAPFNTTTLKQRPAYYPGDIAGLKVRMSNVFAPHYSLPLIGGRTINLSTILRRSVTQGQTDPLLDLFGAKI